MDKPLGVNPSTKQNEKDPPGVDEESEVGG